MAKNNATPVGQIACENCGRPVHVRLSQNGRAHYLCAGELTKDRAHCRRRVTMGDAETADLLAAFNAKSPAKEQPSHDKAPATGNDKPAAKPEPGKPEPGRGKGSWGPFSDW